MKYLITLFKVMSPNVGDSVLIYIGEDKDDFEIKLDWIRNFFESNGTLISVSYRHEVNRVEAFVEYSLVKGKSNYVISY